MDATEKTGDMTSQPLSEVGGEMADDNGTQYTVLPPTGLFTDSNFESGVSGSFSGNEYQSQDSNYAQTYVGGSSEANFGGYCSYDPSQGLPGNYGSNLYGCDSMNNLNGKNNCPTTSTQNYTVDSSGYNPSQTQYQYTNVGNPNQTQYQYTNLGNTSQPQYQYSSLGNPSQPHYQYTNVGNPNQTQYQYTNVGNPNQLQYQYINLSNPSQPQYQYTNLGNIGNSYNMDRSTAGMGGYAPQMSPNGSPTMGPEYNVANSENYESYAPNMSQNAQQFYSNPMSMASQPLMQMQSPYSNTWHSEDTKSQEDDAIQTQTVYSADFQSIGMGNNFNHFNNATPMQMFMPPGMSEPNPYYTAETAAQDYGNYEVGCAVPDVSATTANNVNGMGQVGGMQQMQAQEYSMCQTN